MQEAVKPQLDPYQIEGGRFLAERPRALLADIMGVGKTAQAVHGAELTGAERVLVVCQGGKRRDWEDAFRTWSGAFPDIARIMNGKCVPINKGVTIVSYDLVEKVADYLDVMDWQFDLMIIDEVQFLKSATAKRTKRVLGKGGMAHRCDRIWLLSGTPMLNHPAEMWPWLYTLFPETITINGKLLDYDAFLDRYCVTRDTGYGISVIGGKNMEELKRRIWPITLRRGEEVLTDLPPLTFDTIAIPRASVVHPEDVANLATYEALSAPRALLEAAVAIDAGQDASLDELPDPRGQITTLRKMTAVAKTKPLCDIIINEMAGFKMNKVVVFAIHRDALRLAYDYFNAAGLGPEIIWGGLDPEKRERRLRKFINNQNCRVMLGQIDAAGTGTDGLQHAACEAVFLETSWTPGGNIQAAKRLHRRGQRNPVRVRFAHLTESIDEQVQKVVVRKTKLLAQLFA